MKNLLIISTLFLFSCSSRTIQYKYRVYYQDGTSDVVTTYSPLYLSQGCLSKYQTNGGSSIVCGVKKYENITPLNQ